MLAHVSANADLKNVCIDSTVVRIHACAAGAVVAEALGRAHGGFGCKIYALTDTLGLACVSIWRDVNRWILRKRFP